MNEVSKTGIFAGVAAVLALLVYITDTPLSDSIVDTALEKVGAPLFPTFTDSAKVSDLKVVKYDESLGMHSEFEVAKDSQSGAWILPSHDSYPADASEQIGKASNALIGVKVLQLASSMADDKSLYGVVEPSAEKTQVGATGVGVLVRLTDGKGDRLADLIIGKKVVGSETQRYVRIPNTDQIWVADIDPASFPTDFKQWIDKDLLELSSTDIRQLDIRKYDIVIQGAQAAMVKEFEAVANFDTSNGKWTPGKIVRYVKNVDSPRVLGPDEQLNATKLNEIKTALDSLLIADVARKPEGLASNLKADAKLMEDQASMLSLQSKGFFVPQSESGNEIFSSSGELLVSVKDGVQYLLRFGDTANSLGKASEDENKEAGGAENKGVSVNRYLLVMARLDESQIPEVVLQKLPETIEELDAMEAAKKAAEQPAVGYSADELVPPAPPTGDAPTQDPQAPASEPQQPAKSESSTAETPADPATAPATTESSGETAPAEPKPAPADGSSTSKASKNRLVAFQAENQTESAQAPTTDAASQPASPPVPAENTPAAPAAAPAQEETAQEKQERLQAAREKITKENQRKLDERKDRLEAARKKVQELNAKFAEWYYVISESQYEKLTVSLDDLIQNKSAANPPSINQPGAGFLPNGGLPAFGN